MSFIDEHHILARYGGDFLIFTDSGRFVCKLEYDVDVHKMELVGKSDNMRYFLYAKAEKTETVLDPNAPK